jgi:UDP-N-acetyl-D-mannosaminuronic acid transferase (WecB/TagA/CpsF family)
MNILGVRVDDCSKNQLAKELAKSFDGDKIKIFKINTEFLNRALKDEKFLQTLNSSDLNIVDGRGVLWAARYLTLPISKSIFVRNIQARWQMFLSGLRIIFNPKFITYPIAETIPGVEAFNLMLKTASDARAGVFLFGSSQSTLDLALPKIKAEFPNLKISGILNGYDFQKDETINPVAEIKQN